MLSDHTWKLKYTPDTCDLVRDFYVPALKQAQHYDRLTGYFNAGALALAARGIEGLVRNEGRMRLIVGCTLHTPEIEAIVRGEKLRDQVERHLLALPLAPPDNPAADALELLAWMVAGSHLDVKVAVPCDGHGQPVGNSAIFHAKAGIIEDRAGNKIAWTGSLNETSAGWQNNWESIQVFRSWGPEPGRVAGEERNFARLWADRSPRAKVLDIPEAVRQDLLRFLPGTALPSRLRRTEPPLIPPSTWPSGRARLIWAFIRNAANLPDRGAHMGEATAAITPWPHQNRAFERLYAHWPPRLLIADEVGLGKTIQAGLLLRQAWLSGLARRVLILAPKALLKQWQIELREKFNLNWPIYDGRHLLLYESQALRGKHRRLVDPNRWFEEPVVLASSQLVRRKDRAKALVEKADYWDLVVLDEAHHARRRGAGSEKERGANALLKLMRTLKTRTKGLVLLTATPMQMHPIEVWDLMDLMGLPPEWDEGQFLEFCHQISKPNPTGAVLDQMARMFRAVEDCYGRTDRETVQRVTELSRFRAGKLIAALRSKAKTPRHQLDPSERLAAIAVMRSHSPIRRLISRHTRELLRRYNATGMLSVEIADRQVDDCFVAMSDAELSLYKAVDEYISRVYAQASTAERSAVGFVMTVYRRRFASSFASLQATLERRLESMGPGSELSAGSVEVDDEDIPDDESLDEVPDVEEAADLASRALDFEESGEIERLLEMIRELPPDSKLDRLAETLDELVRRGYRQVMVFTQYTDTMDFLRDALRRRLGLKIMCFSGRGGEIAGNHDSDDWRRIDREQVKRQFKDGDADLLLCTDAAAEGLNFQFCGALVNYDMPWNPMRVEQRIGRIDRVGQRHPEVRIVNLHYEDTVETDVYRALRRRIGLFQNVVGSLQPILARMPRAVTSAVLAGRDSADARNVADRIERQIDEEEQGGFDIDAALDSRFEVSERIPSPITLDDLDRVIRDPELMPPDTRVQPMGPREYSLLAPDMAEAIRVTTDPDYYKRNSDSVELWSPGNRFFRQPTSLPDVDIPDDVTLKDLLDR